MSTKYIFIEEKLEAAMADAANQGPGKINVARLAKKHDVPEMRLRRRLNGGSSKSTRSPSNKKLTDTQENAILSWIRHLDNMGLAARPSLIRASADQLLLHDHEAGTPIPRVGEKWVSNFLRRYPELSMVRQKAQELLRMSHDYETCAKFFDRLEKVIREEGITPNDIWNMDKIGFRVGIGGQQWVLTFQPSKEARIGSNTNRELITCIEAVSAAGESISPLIIMTGVVHSEAWAENDLPADTLIATSESGYTNEVIALRWIEHFAERTAGLTRGLKRLLIFDGHNSHCTQQFIEVCEAHDIIPFTLPPHSSHFLQPLDVSVFQPYKHWHKEAVDQATRFGEDNFGKVEFLSALNQIRQKTFKVNTIKTGFEA